MPDPTELRAKNGRVFLQHCIRYKLPVTKKGMTALRRYNGHTGGELANRLLLDTVCVDDVNIHAGDGNIYLSVPADEDTPEARDAIARIVSRQISVCIAMMDNEVWETT